MDYRQQKAKASPKVPKAHKRSMIILEPLLSMEQAKAIQEKGRQEVAAMNQLKRTNAASEG